MLATDIGMYVVSICSFRYLRQIFLQVVSSKLPMSQLSWSVITSCLGMVAITVITNSNRTVLAQDVSASPAQIRSDGTLSTTVSSSDTLNFVVEKGDRRGDHLFHSFDAFSIPLGGSAQFENSNDINIIFSRVTGGQPSNINGTLSANGTADVFFMNPTGILFGPNAQLNIGGSFIATTAEHIAFANGYQFSAVAPRQTPLLTISTPIGLQFGPQAGPITIKNSGYRLEGMRLSPVIDQGSPLGLRIEAGRTLGLLGQTLRLSDGIVSAPGGQTILAGVESGMVSLESSPWGWDLGFDSVERFGDLSLSQSALVGSSSALSSRIKLQGHNIHLLDNSFVWINSQGQEAGGAIEVNAQNRLQMQRDDSSAVSSGPLFSQNLGLGPGADISVTAGQMEISRSANVRTITHAPGDGGDVTVQVVNNLDIIGTDSAIPAEIHTITMGPENGDGGTASIAAGNIHLLDGGSIVTTTFGSGNSGELSIEATESITIAGAGSTPAIKSNIGSSSFSLLGGDANQVSVHTPRLTLDRSGTISANTFGTGDAGSVMVNASELIRIRGYANGQDTLPLSSISSAALESDAVLRRFIGLDLRVTGDGGNVEIATPNLMITDGAQITVRNDGTGNAGDRLQIEADEIVLEGGSINAITQTGNGGNIMLTANVIGLADQSSINTETSGGGNGGNIILDSSVIFGINNSDIVANALGGNGGNVFVRTQGLFGLEFRNERTDQSDITASSEFGLQGTVKIVTLDIDPVTDSRIALTTVVDTQQVETHCSMAHGSRFNIVGRGGLPLGPDAYGGSDRPWSDILADFGVIPTEESELAIGAYSPDTNGVSSSEESYSEENSQRWQNGFEEATGMAIAPNGAVQLVAALSQHELTSLPSCIKPLTSL